MNNDRKHLIPDLRFPEFVNDGEWRKKILGNFLNFQTGFPFESAGFNSDKIGVRLIKNRDLKSDDSIIFYKNSFDEKYIVSNGDVLIGMDGDFTPSIWKKGSALLNQRVGRIVTADKKNEVFFYYFLIIHLKKIEDLTPRTTVKHLSHSVVEKIFEPIPNANEQQKIASCLSSLDEVITAQKEKLELLKNHKKGLMQNLFPQEGETVPKFRFPEFENDGDWENIPLKDLSEVITKGTTPTSLGFSYVDCGVNFIKIESIIDGKINLNKAAFITNECNDVLKRSQLKENDILLSIAGALGVVTTVNKDILPANTNQALSIIRLHNENQKDYLKAFLNSNQISQEINKIKAGAAQPNISLNQVQNFRILIPKNIIEQEKIATCLSSLDELISSQTEKIEKLQLHKKGLMQGLFPKMID